MIQWIHAGVGLVTLLLLIIFLIVYVGVQSSVTTRRCGAPLPGARGNPGLKGQAGVAVYPGPAGDAGTVPGETGPQGFAAAGIITGPTPDPIGTGFYTGQTGASGWPGPDGGLLDSSTTSPPIDFKYYNFGIGSPLDNYSDTKVFDMELTCLAGSPSTVTTSGRLVRVGKIVAFQILQFHFNHGGKTNDFIKLPTDPFWTPVVMKEYFFTVSNIATEPYVIDIPVMVYDQSLQYPQAGLLHLKIEENSGTTGKITQFWLQFRSSWNTIAAGTPLNFDIEQCKFPFGTAGTFGILSDITVVWLLTNSS
jgi:hypothetical protein